MAGSIPAGWIKNGDGSYSKPKKVGSFGAAAPPPEVRFYSPNLEVEKSTDEQKLNKTEKAYLRYLQMLMPSLYIGVQNITLKLADDCRLTPDFNFINANGRLEFVDVKGYQREDALIKMKVAARTYRWADFTIVKRNKDFFNGWQRIEVKP